MKKPVPWPGFTLLTDPKETVSSLQLNKGEVYDDSIKSTNTDRTTLPCYDIYNKADERCGMGDEKTKRR